MYMWASCCHVYFRNFDQGSAFIREVRQSSGQLQSQGQHLTLYRMRCGRKTKEERQCTMAMDSIAACVKDEPK